MPRPIRTRSSVCARPAYRCSLPVRTSPPSRARTTDPPVSGLGEPGGCYVDALVGRGQRHTYVLVARRTVEIAWCHEDPALGQPADRLHAGLLPRGPQVEAAE